MSTEQQSWHEMVKLVGERVTVILNYDNPEARSSGILLELSDEGEARMDTGSRVIRCWPVLRVVKVNAWDCHDPQCNDSTWDHPCPVPADGWELWRP